MDRGKTESSKNQEHDKLFLPPDCLKCIYQVHKENNTWIVVCRDQPALYSPERQMNYLTFYEQMESVFLLLIFCCLFSLLVISSLQVMYQ